VTDVSTDVTQNTLAAPPYPGKSPELLGLGDGLNFGPPLAQISGTIVPNPLFFLRSNYPPPSLAPSEWRMRIDGRVQRPLTLGLEDLQALPSRTQEVWLECAGNSRRRFDPPGEGNQWDDQAVSNAVFTGVSLSAVLDQVTFLDDAIEIVATGADSATFQRSLPIEVARQPEILLAWEMNGEPIPQANGGPVRMIVPAWAGIASVKWPVRLEVLNTPFGGYYHSERYIIVDADGRTLRSVREMPVKSLIAQPEDGATLELSAHVISGFAWSGLGQIEQVEVSTDNQHTWSPARLIHGEGPFAWTRWESIWIPRRPGPAILASRATDSAGNLQPTEAAWNKFGYLMNAIATRTVTVQA
jgi:DMSO/TMAO reductase YedYZ molybdopterin-dependent catalytic subunit